MGARRWPVARRGRGRTKQRGKGPGVALSRWRRPRRAAPVMEKASDVKKHAERSGGSH